MKKTVFITGGAGFIGSALIRFLIEQTDVDVVNVDKLTYAGNMSSLDQAQTHPRHHFHQTDITDTDAIKSLVQKYQPDYIMHLAAESHVDRSIDNPDAFIQTNIIGTYRLLEVANEYYQGLTADKKTNFLFHHISTDEVYGSLGETGLFTETTSYKPNSPYSASKASSDHLVRSWHKTYGLPTVISNCSNNYGPFQFPEKLIPLIVQKALAGENLPIYGKGDNIRDWLYVADHVKALWLIVNNGVPGEVYNVGGHNEKTNLQVVETICRILDEVKPSKNQDSYMEQISYVEDRPGHDKRYAIDAQKIALELGWLPDESFESGIRKTILWYLEHKDWMESVTTEYQGQRLGVTEDLLEEKSA